mmetsp:Transcript_12913/g.36372  ORF Transcript_12913/g.36372 Transcript_12913/m.36372 type:complete len:1026 (-) Transcript_12913:1763-4840(-)
MPTQSRGFFACDYCGLQHDTVDEAIEHEQTQCRQALSMASARQSMGYLGTQQQQGLPQQYPSYYLQQQQQQQQTHRHGFTSGMGPLAGSTVSEAHAYSRTEPYGRYNRGMSPAQGAAGAEATYSQKSVAMGGLLSSSQIAASTRCFPLVDSPTDPMSSRLHRVDQVTCQNIELFEATPEVIAEYERSSGDANRIELRQVGIRCRNCGFGSNNNLGNPNSTTPGAIIFPVDIDSVGDCVRKLSDRHLISCGMTHSDVKVACREQREMGIVASTEGNAVGHEQASRSALIDYCVELCRRLEITKKGNNKLGIEFIGSAATTSIQNRSSWMQQKPPTDPFSPNFPFYQESDRTWHCKYCSYLPHHIRDPKSIWASHSGVYPPDNFIDQHLSVCQAYRQQSLSSAPPGRVVMPSEQSSFGAIPAYVNPSSMQQVMPGQLSYPPASWEAAASLGGMGAHMQYPPTGLMQPYPDAGYRFGQHRPHLPPGIVQPHSMDTSLGSRNSVRFLPPLGQGDSRGRYAERGGGSMMPSMQQTGSRGPPYGLDDAGATPDTMKDAMSFLANFDSDYYARDQASAAIPKLVLDEDHLLLTDYFFWLMKQLRLVRFTENDRKTRGGKREKIKIGYGGLQCIHCADMPMSRKFFWSNVDRLANSFAEIPGHVLKCRRCPQTVKDALMRLKRGHPDQMSKLPRGSQKIFFRRMWRRLHEGDPQDDDVAVESSAIAPAASDTSRPPVPSIKTSPEKSIEELSHSGSMTVTSDETILVIQRSAKEAAKALVQSALGRSGPPSPSSRILVAIPEDKEWLSDIDSYVRKQLEVFCATEEDVAAAKADRKYPISVGQVGIRCIHCAISEGNDAVGHAIAYPFSISGIYESVKEFHRLHLDTCKHSPATTKAKLKNMQKGASSLSSVLRKYYTLSAKALGLVDTKDGIRTGGESSPINSVAAFTFSEMDDAATPTKSKEANEEGKESNLTESEAAPTGKKPDGKNMEAGFEEAAASTSRGTKRSGSPFDSPDIESKTKMAKIENSVEV